MLSQRNELKINLDIGVSLVGDAVHLMLPGNHLEERLRPDAPGFPARSGYAGDWLQGLLCQLGSRNVLCSSVPQAAS